MKTKELIDIVFRYLLILLLAIGNLAIFYLIFTPLTVYPVFWLLKIFYTISINGNILSIAINNTYIGIELIKACIAGAAYFLLLALNLITRNIKLKARVLSILFTFAVFLFLNVIRIFILSILYVKDFAYFDIVHSFFWNFLSIVFVIAIWFFSVRIFKIKAIPAYSDIRFIYKSTNRKRK